MKIQSWLLHELQQLAVQIEVEGQAEVPSQLTVMTCQLALEFTPKTLTLQRRGSPVLRLLCAQGWTSCLEYGLQLV